MHVWKKTLFKTFLVLIVIPNYILFRIFKITWLFFNRVPTSTRMERQWQTGLQCNEVQPFIKFDQGQNSNHLFQLCINNILCLFYSPWCLCVSQYYFLLIFGWKKLGCFSRLNIKHRECCNNIRKSLLYAQRRLLFNIFLPNKSTLPRRQTAQTSSHANDKHDW